MGRNCAPAKSSVPTLEEGRLRKERVALKICDALEYLHGQGVVYHDLTSERWWERRTGTFRTRSCHEPGWEKAESCEAMMLDIFYIAVVIAFFLLLWGFTKASERL